MTSPRSAIIVVDMQEDFCSPVSPHSIPSILSPITILLTSFQNGSLAVAGGRELAPTINKLLALPFTAKIASQDWHPANHISFDNQHEPPHNIACETVIPIVNPDNPSHSEDLQIWPVHCIKDTPGAEIISEINSSTFDLIVRKGQDQRTEMYSAFADMFGRKGTGVVSHDLGTWLREREVEWCFVVGLTGDCCVRDTALAAVWEGFETFVVEDAVRSVDQGDKGWGAAKRKLEGGGVAIIGSQDERLMGLMS